MRAIRRTTAFKKDFKKVRSTPKHAEVVEVLLKTTAELLVVDQPLPEHFRDHVLSGNWRGFRECHLKPDLLLIYRQTDDGLELQLARLGSHSDLFG